MYSRLTPSMLRPSSHTVIPLGFASDADIAGEVRGCLGEVDLVRSGGCPFILLDQRSKHQNMTNGDSLLRSVHLPHQSPQHVHRFPRKRPLGRVEDVVQQLDALRDSRSHGEVLWSWSSSCRDHFLDMHDERQRRGGLEYGDRAEQAMGDLGVEHLG